MSAGAYCMYLSLLRSLTPSLMHVALSKRYSFLLGHPMDPLSSQISCFTALTRRLYCSHHEPRTVNNHVTYVRPETKTKEGSGGGGYDNESTKRSVEGRGGYSQMKLC